LDLYPRQSVLICGFLATIESGEHNKKGVGSVADAYAMSYAAGIRKSLLQGFHR
jgi:hypothetical protein